MELSLVRKGDFYELDCRDMVCPYPVIMTKLAMQRVYKLEVLTNNPPSVKDIEKIAAKEGWKVEKGSEGGVWRIRIWR
ncbi:MULTISPECIES: sulfurtransferase TusA family protein [unclassified Archaeoglobus]|jgi:TusA-related sulfurtransferase|uniref:sulfurtransferase TusA family protein n=1 Tax=unclassified Archaeoglobus TaxID=2643606 RepID=UPI0025BE522B|nr:MULTISPECIES: sulfurtransferase TusA family protein [unclassified Archaeoglobus]